ncbi:MAG: propionyl-CoA synthetase [Rhodospirillales bacterium]
MQRKRIMTNAYEDAYRRSLDDPEGFWGDAAKAVHWFKEPEKVLDDSNPPFYRWFKDGVTNTCYNSLDRHVDAGRGDQLALIWDSPAAGGQVRQFTYSELRDQVARAAGVLRDLGVTKGDRVLIYMPMVPEAVMAMQACARLGAIHSVVFGGFASNELAVRIDDAKPKVIISCSNGIEGKRIVEYAPLLNGAIDIAKHKPSACLIYQREQATFPLVAGRDHDWASRVAAAEPAACAEVEATDPLYILYTSGTTGQPKGVVRDTGGHLVALAWTMTHIYNTKPGDVYWAASDVGWVVGHSYIAYGPFIGGCTNVMFEGKPVGTPDAGAFWRMIADHKINVLFTAPTAFRAIRKEDPEGSLIGSYDMSTFKALFLAGERTDPETLNWAIDKLGVPVVDHWWQTETGWAIAANCLGLHEFPIKAGSPTKPAPGYDVQILTDEGHKQKAGEIGSIVVKLPLPPGTFPTLWNAEARYKSSYLEEFPGYYNTSDAGMIDEDGYVYVMGRTDDIINVAGHRLSTGAMEEVLASHPDVAECAVIGANDKLKGELPVGFLVLKAGVTKSEEDVLKEVVKLVREKIGPVAAFKTACVVDRLPKTRSGKILRGTMKKIADSEDYKLPATIDDPAILDEIDAALSSIGYAHGAK